MFKILSAVENPLIVLMLVLCPLTKCYAADTHDSMLVNGDLMDAGLLFGSQKESAHMVSAVHGSYTRGCLAGASQLPADGPHWQAMRPSRNREWGHPVILDYIERLSADAARLDRWPGLLVGDISQPRGGPMPSGHKSHQVGLDVDIWFRPAPPKSLSAEERESLNSESVVKGPFELNRNVWTEVHARLLKRAASYSNVARIFVHPTIKKELCSWAGGDRAWLRKIRAWYGHDDHFHVRLDCPEGKGPCLGQDQPPEGDGCGEELAWWFSPDAYRDGSEKKKPQPLTLDDLPAACKLVLRWK